MKVKCMVDEREMYDDCIYKNHIYDYVITEGVYIVISKYGNNYFLKDDFNKKFEIINEQDI